MEVNQMSTTTVSTASSSVTESERIAEVARLNAKYPKYWHHGGNAPEYHQGYRFKGRIY